ncbi:MAG: GldG family protein [Chloroflexota bacterium]
MNNRTKSLISTISGFAALGFFAMALVYWAAFTDPAFNLNIGQWDGTLRVLMVLAIIAFSVYLIIAPESIGASVGKRSTRLTANALLVSLVAIGIAIAINIIVDNVPVARADLTAGQDFTLSDQTLKVLQELDARGTNVTAVAFYSDRAASGVTRTQMEDMLKEYDSHSSRLSYEFVDPYLSPARATELGATRLGTVVFDDGKKRAFANSITEADFTSAILRMMETQTKTVAFLSGHGERDPNGADEASYSQAKAALERENYQVLSWNLVTSPTLTISNVNVLVIASPLKALTAQETQTVSSYLDSGGRVLMMVDPQMPPEAIQPMASILQKYGVTPEQGAILDQHSASPQEPTLVVVNNFPPNDITTDLARTQAAIVFPFAMGLKPPTSTVGSFVVTQLAQSSPGQDVSWLETDLQTQAAQYDEGKDIPGPVSIGLSIAPSATDSVTNTTVPKTRLVVYSDADFPSNVALQSFPANVDLFANSVSWLAGANELVSIRAKEPTAPRLVTLDTTQKNLLGVVTVLGLPMLVLLFGAFTWWRRR